MRRSARVMARGFSADLGRSDLRWHRWRVADRHHRALVDVDPQSLTVSVTGASVGRARVLHYLATSVGIPAPATRAFIGDEFAVTDRAMRYGKLYDPWQGGPRLREVGRLNRKRTRPGSCQSARASLSPGGCRGANAWRARRFDAHQGAARRRPRRESLAHADSEASQ